MLASSTLFAVKAKIKDVLELTPWNRTISLFVSTVRRQYSATMRPGALHLEIVRELTGERHVANPNSKVD